jgi:hypothetical protein
VTTQPQSGLVPSHIRFFTALIGGYPALLMSDMTKARFKPRRKVIGFRSPFFGDRGQAEDTPIAKL